MRHFIFLINLLAMPTWAAGSISHFEISGDTLEFATSEAKAGARPSCVTADNQALWAVSLTTNSGRGIYSMLITATSMNMPVAVESAGDCADKEGVERASSVKLVAAQ